MSRVEIILDEKGGIKVDAIDFPDDSCVKATEFLDELFGCAEEVEHKVEFYNKNLNKDKLTSGFCG